MNTENIKLINLVNYEVEQRIDENGHLSEDDKRFITALDGAVNSFFQKFGNPYWDYATVEIQAPTQVNDETVCSYILKCEIRGQTHQECIQFRYSNEFKPDELLIQGYTSKYRLLLERLEREKKFRYDEAELKKRATELFEDEDIIVDRTFKHASELPEKNYISLSIFDYFGYFLLSDTGEITFQDDEYFEYDEPFIEQYINYLQQGLALLRQFRDEQDKNRQA